MKRLKIGVVLLGLELGRMHKVKYQILQYAKKYKTLYKETIEKYQT